VNGAGFSRSGGSCGESGQVLEPQASCTVVLAFAPESLGSATGSLDIAHDGTNGPSTVSLSGVGAAPQPLVDPAVVDFGPWPIDELSDPVTVTLTNDSDVELAVGAFT